MLTTLKKALDANANTGKHVIFRKSISQVTVAGNWFDLNMSSGNPRAFFYASTPLTLYPLSSSDGGIASGGNVSPLQKVLKRSLFLSITNSGMPMPLILCDYVGYYPFCDMGETDEQIMDNTLSITRYTSGDGLKIMPVLVAAGSGGQTFRVRYTNQAGVSDRFTTTTIMNTSVAIGNIVSSQVTNVSAAGPFLTLQEGDTGVRSIEGVQMISGPDVGLFTLVLVKPLAQSQIAEQTAPVEIDYLRDTGTVVEIKDNAYLNFICLPAGSLSSAIFMGELDFIWG